MKTGTHMGSPQQTKMALECGAMRPHGRGLKVKVNQGQGHVRMVSISVAMWNRHLSALLQTVSLILRKSHR